MLGKFLKKKFGRKEKELPEAEQFYSPLRIGLHSTLEVDSVDFLTLTGKMSDKFTVPSGRLDVVAIGTVDNDPDEIFKIYAVDSDENQFIIQLISSMDPRTGERNISETMIFNHISEEEPLSQARYDELYDMATDRYYDLDGVEYRREWAPTERDINLFKFKERMVNYSGGNDHVNHQMLFSRRLDEEDDSKTEFVLVNLEDQQTFVTSIGFTSSTFAVKVI